MRNRETPMKIIETLKKTNRTLLEMQLGMVFFGGIKIGDYVKIGAGAVVCTDVPSHSTVVSQPSRIIVRGAGA